MNKRIFIISLACFILFMGCASTSSSGLTKSITDDGYISTYDAVTNAEIIDHEDLEFSPMKIYNLRDSFLGERENIRVRLINDLPVVVANYQFRDWIFLDSIIFLDADNNRLVLKDGVNSRDVISGDCVREQLSIILLPEQFVQLKAILANSPKVCFSGSKGRTDLFEIKPKISEPMLSVLNRSKSINNITN